MIKQFFLKTLAVIFVGVAVLGTHSLLSVSAQTENEIRGKISETEDKIKKVEQEIIQYRNDLEKIATLKKSLKNLITELDITRKKLSAEILITSAKADSTDFKIRQLSTEITRKEDEVAAYEASLIEVLRGIHEKDNSTLAEVALSNESFDGLWNDLEAVNQFSETVRKNIDILKNLKTELEQKQELKQREKEKLLDLKIELSDRKKIAEDNKKRNATILAETNNKESEYAKILEQKIALKDAFEKEMSDYETTLKFILDPSSIPPRGTKVFSPPIVPLSITQQFGKTSASGRLYASGTHNGTDFRASIGTQVLAMGSGIVAGTGNTDLTCPGASFGKWILIRYDNGLASTYAHLSYIKVLQGDKVSVGEVVGYSGNTGYSTGPHLHVSLYASAGVNIETRPSKSCGGRMYTMPISPISAYLDPMDYL